MLTFWSRNLSADCTQVVPDREVKAEAMAAETAVERLRAFADMPALALVGSDALIYLANADTKLAVQHENGRLFATLVPEAANIAVEQSPEEIVGLLDRERAVLNTQWREKAGQRGAGRRPSWRHRLNSRWTVGVLAAVAAVLVYVSFAPETPAGIRMISDPSRVASLHLKFNGRYGETGAEGGAVLLVENGRFAVFPGGVAGPQDATLMDSGYRYGLRGEAVVLVIANGAVLEPGKEGSLKFNDAVYPRMARR